MPGEQAKGSARARHAPTPTAPAPLTIPSASAARAAGRWITGTGRLAAWWGGTDPSAGWGGSIEDPNETATRVSGRLHGADLLMIKSVAELPWNGGARHVGFVHVDLDPLDPGNEGEGGVSQCPDGDGGVAPTSAVGTSPVADMQGERVGSSVKSGSTHEGVRDGIVDRVVPFLIGVECGRASFKDRAQVLRCGYHPGPRHPSLKLRQAEADDRCQGVRERRAPPSKFKGSGRQHVRQQRHVGRMAPSRGAAPLSGAKGHGRRGSPVVVSYPGAARPRRA